MRKKTFTKFLQRWSATTIVLFVTLFGAVAQDVPYPVWFDLGDQPELKAYSGFRKGVGKTFNKGDVSGIQWEGTQTTFWYGSVTNATGTGSNDTYAFGDNLDFNFRYITKWTVKIPYLIAGNYDFWMGIRNQGNYMYIDSLFVLNPGVDSTKQYLNEAGVVQVGAWLAGRNYTTPTKNVKGEKICNITIPQSGSYWLSFYTRGAGGSSLTFGMDQFQFFPTKVIKGSLDQDSIVVKDPQNLTLVFDNAGYANPTTPLKDFTTVGCNKLPYQAKDSSVYTKYNASIKFGNYFGDAPVQILRDEDKWTRMIADTLPVIGTLDCQLPAGNYYYWVKDGVYKGSFTVTGDAIFDFSVNSYDVVIDAGAESWIIDKALKVYDFDTKTILSGEATFDITGKATINILPGHYYYTINGTYDNGEFTVVDAALSIDKKKTKYNVTFNCGSDAWFASKQIKVVLNSDKSVEMYNAATNANGDLTMPLPDQTYYYNLADGMQVDTFIVSGGQRIFNKTGRYNSIFNVGNVVNGYTLDVFRNDTFKVYTGTVTLGVQTYNSIPDGKYHFRVYKTGSDSVMVISKHSYVVSGSDYVYGNASNLDQPLVTPYPVYYDICQQPEILWGKGGVTFAANSISGIQTSSTKAMTYNFSTSDASSSNQYINGDHLVVGIDTVGLVSEGIKPYIKFKTPWINAGYYNVYINQRWTTAATRPIIDSTYLDGKLLSVTDGVVRTLNDWANGAVTRQINAGTNLNALHLGSVNIETSGLHELKLVSNIGGSTQVWLDMLEFIPVDLDVSYAGGTYYPRFDRCGNALFAGSPVDNALQSDGSDHAIPYQVSDPSVYTGFTKQLVFDAGAISNGDVLVLKKAEDNWTRTWVDTFNVDGDTTQMLPGTYNFFIKEEGLSGNFTMNDNYTVTIPSSIPTIVSGWANLKTDESLSGNQRNIDLKVLVDMNYTDYNLQIDTMKGTAQILVSGVANDPYVLGVNDTLSFLAVDIEVDANNMATPAFLASGIQAQYEGWGRFTASNGYLGATDITGVKYQKDIQLSTFPNPTKDKLFIQMSQVGIKDAYTIYNINGNAVASGKISKTTTEVSLKGQPTGIYYVKIKSGTRTTTTKLVKQ